MKDNVIKYLLSTVLLIFAGVIGVAQSVRDIVVSYNKSFTDHVSMASDSRDMDIMVKFVFNEDKNQLTVSLISYRYLFVFSSDVRFGNVIHHNRLEPEDFPFVVDFPEKSRFIVSKDFIKSIPKPRKNYKFNKWITYSGLQPVPTKYKMVNDYIEQKFDITNYGDFATVTLGDVFVMDKTPSKKHPDDYTIVASKDLNLEYRITIVRNPCFGMDDETELATNALSAVAEGYTTFKNLFGSRVVANEKELMNFTNMKSVLKKQFQAKNSDSKCPDLKSIWDKYDCYVDSISVLNCEIKSTEGQEKGVALNFDATEITTLARQIDRNVSRYLASKDNVEKQDLIKECKDIISEVNSLIGTSTGYTPEQRKAVSLFRQAATYFRNTCEKKK